IRDRYSKHLCGSTPHRGLSPLRKVLCRVRLTPCPAAGQGVGLLAVNYLTAEMLLQNGETPDPFLTRRPLPRNRRGDGEGEPLGRDARHAAAAMACGAV